MRPGAAMRLRALGWLLGALPAVGGAAQLPLWEIGAGVGGVSLPDYRGADEQRTYALPIPYVVYRGEKLKVDRQAVRGLLFKSDRAELDMSFNASPPVDSNKNRAREGMSDLRSTVEFGPSLKIRLGESDASARVDLRLPLRMVHAVDSRHSQQVGYVFSPKLNVDWHGNGGRQRWNLGFAAGPVFADKKHHDYYYAVAPEFATTSRPAYAARGGYGGMQFTVAANRRFENVWLGAFVRMDDMHGAAFADSPLVKSRRNFMGGFGVSWVFGKSETRVEAED